MAARISSRGKKRQSWQEKMEERFRSIPNSYDPPMTWELMEDRKGSTIYVNKARKLVKKVLKSSGEDRKENFYGEIYLFALAHEIDLAPKLHGYNWKPRNPYFVSSLCEWDRLDKLVTTKSSRRPVIDQIKRCVAERIATSGSVYADLNTNLDYKDENIFLHILEYDQKTFTVRRYFVNIIDWGAIGQ